MALPGGPGRTRATLAGDTLDIPTVGRARAPGRAAHIRPMTSWPEPGAAGLYRVACSCGAWQADGTATEVDAAAASHDDSPGRRHVVRIIGEITVRQAALWPAS